MTTPPLPPESSFAGRLPTDLSGINELAELALDLRWSWNHATDKIWRKLDGELWEATQNPWVVLQTVSRRRIERVLAEPGFRERVDDLVELRRSHAACPAWFQTKHGQAALSCVAYFSMEFMLSEALPIYSGGLGNVAGDQLKAASDLGVPVVGVGLLYQKGYFRQAIDHEGSQRALFPYNDPGQLPISPVRDADGEWLRLEIPLPGCSVWVRAWQVQVGRVKLYLLDSNDAANFPAHRGITSELYGGGPELRLAQELLLGIGGWRLLAALDLEPDVCHLNEGHAAFAVLERARSFMRQHNTTFDEALAVTRAGNLFTTHTAVDAGFDRFEPSLITHHLGDYAERELGISTHELLGLGRLDPANAQEPFNMAYLAVRGSGAVNAVSRLHAAVSRRLFAPLFPRWPEREIPVGHVTNGVHMPSWDSAACDKLWTDACGKDRWLGRTDTLEAGIRSVSDGALWDLRGAATAELVTFARQKLSLQLGASGASVDTLADARQALDPNALTLGFARRFATYKRPNLLLKDPERLVRLLTNPERPVQLVLAGKAHPADLAGQTLIKEWVQFVRRPEVRRHAVFLADYDVQVAAQLVSGVDVWINTPRRPWEACGTSGMKVLVNGGINLSELDGWWAEAYRPEVGWRLGDGQEHDHDASWDAKEAEALFDILERQVIPEFYQRGSDHIPTAWVSRMRESMATLTPQYSASRAVTEYTEQHYLPAAAAYRGRAAAGAAFGKQLTRTRRALEGDWSSLGFGEVRFQSSPAAHSVSAEVFLGRIPPDAVGIEVYAEGRDDGPPERHEMTCLDPLESAQHHLYRATFAGGRPAADYTVRVRLRIPGLAVPLESCCIRWQR